MSTEKKRNEDGKKFNLGRKSEEDFNHLRQQHLNSRVLSKESLLVIRGALGLTPDSGKVHVDCDEMHGHSYACLNFDDRNSALYERLISEIERYQRVLQELGVEVDSALGIGSY